MKVLMESIITQLKDVQNGKLWMGANFEKRLNTISYEEAFIQPVPGMHSVAEILSHVTVWRKETIIKIKTGKGSLTDSADENWLPNERLKEKGWSIIKTDFQNSLDELIELLNTKEDDFLKQAYYDADYKGNYAYSFLIYGMLHHDIYHLGQLGIIIKFLKEKQATKDN